MAVKYKKRCMRCKKNFILATWKSNYPMCYDCQKSEMEGEIKDPKMKKLLNIPLEYYKQNGFLRNIKINCIRYGELSERQIEAFKKVVKQLKEGKV